MLYTYLLSRQEFFWGLKVDNRWMCFGKDIELSTTEYNFYYKYNYYIIIMLHKNVSKYILTEPGDILITILIIITIIINY